jgi:hypothetical protein
MVAYGQGSKKDKMEAVEYLFSKGVDLRNIAKQAK